MTIVSQKGASKPSVRTPQLVRVETSPDRKADNALPLSCGHNTPVADSHQRKERLILWLRATRKQMGTAVGGVLLKTPFGVQIPKSQH